MKTFLYVASATLALAACNQRADTATDATATTAAAPVDTTMATAPATTGVATGSMAGTYEMRAADGTMTTQMVNADGTYRSVSKGKETTGNWRMDGTRACYDPEGAAVEQCWTTTAPGADGSFTATAPDGTTMTVRKTAAGAAAAM